MFVAPAVASGEPHPATPPPAPTPAPAPPATTPSVELFNKKGNEFVPMTPDEVKADADASTALASAKTAVTWFDEHFGSSPLGTPASPVKIGLVDDYSNAYWDGKMLTLGRGGANGFKPLVSVDVVAHELLHARLDKYPGTKEGGAVHESVADIVAEVIDGGDWTLGGDVTPGGIRDLAAPKVDHLSKIGSNPEVHTLAGLASLAAVRSSEVIGDVATAKLWWNSTKDIGDKPTLETLATATVSAAEKSWGAGTREAQAVRDAWVSVGVLK